jgi:LAS superfamily LD-carboxypeptidase LdcB
MGYINPYSTNIIEHYNKRNADTLKGINTEIQSDLKSRMSGFINDVFMNEKILLLAYSGYRTPEEQQILYDKYISGEGGKAAKPYFSWHNYGQAIDVVPITPEGVADWNSHDWNTIHNIASNWGLKNGSSFNDNPHIYDNLGYAIESYRNTFYSDKDYKPSNNISSTLIHTAKQNWFWLLIPLGLFFKDKMKKKGRKKRA